MKKANAGILDLFPNLIFIVLVSMIISCDSDLKPNFNQVDFQSPVVNQKNYYIRYSGNCGQIQPTGDTLILRVASFTGNETNGGEMQVEESFTPGSPLYTPYPFIYAIQWRPEYLVIDPNSRQQSQLFFFFGSDTLRLKQSPSVTLEQRNCVLWNGPQDFKGDLIGKTTVFKIGVESFGFKKIVSCVPFILDLDAYLVYDKNNIYSSYTSGTGGFGPNPEIWAYALKNIP